MPGDARLALGAALAAGAAAAVLLACTGGPSSTQATFDGGSSAPPPPCATNPQTYLEIINACTDAAFVDKHPVLPLLLPDGGLPQLP